MSFNFVGCLQEFCVSQYLNLPLYQTAKSGASHAKTFTVTCKVGKRVTTGSSFNKKEAKNKAAASLLSLLMKSAKGSSKHLDEKTAAVKKFNEKEMETILKISAQFSSPSELQPRYNTGTDDMNNPHAVDVRSNKSLNFVNVNTVGRLQEISQANKWEMPLYLEGGTVHAQHFTKCILRGITTEGCSVTKKEAKKIAAGKMLTRLNISCGFISKVIPPSSSPGTFTMISDVEITTPNNVNSNYVSDDLIDFGITNVTSTMISDVKTTPNNVNSNYVSDDLIDSGITNVTSTMISDVKTTPNNVNSNYVSDDLIDFGITNVTSTMISDVKTTPNNVNSNYVSDDLIDSGITNVTSTMISDVKTTPNNVNSNYVSDDLIDFGITTVTSTMISDVEITTPNNVNPNYVSDDLIDFGITTDNAYLHTDTKENINTQATSQNEWDFMFECFS